MEHVERKAQSYQQKLNATQPYVLLSEMQWEDMLAPLLIYA